MTARRDRIAAKFGRAAHYDSVARTQKESAALLGVRLERLFEGRDPPERILEFGCGTGELTKIVRRLFPRADILAIDIAPEMIERARNKVPDARFLVMNAENPELPGSFDLICSNLCAQWFFDRSEAFRRLASHLRPKGHLALTTLARDSFLEWRAACAACDAPSGFPDYPTRQDLSREWPIDGVGTWDGIVLHDRPGSGRDFLRDLRTIGATTPRAGAQVSTPGELRRAIAAFDAGSRMITYDIALGVFEKARGVFVTGTDTGIGKTLVSAILTRALNATYWKPLQTGLAEEAGDTPTVATLAGLSAARIVPPSFALREPLSPLAAAQAENVSIDVERMTLPDASPLVVEGAGGLMVPVTDDVMMIDLVARFALPVVLVARSGLGTINHTLLSLEALRQRNIPISGVMLSGPPNPGNREAIEKFGRVRVLAEIPFLDTVTPDTVAEQAARLTETSPAALER